MMGPLLRQLWSSSLETLFHANLTLLIGECGVMGWFDVPIPFSWEQRRFSEVPENTDCAVPFFLRISYLALPLRSVSFVSARTSFVPAPLHIAIEQEDAIRNCQDTFLSPRQQSVQKELTACGSEYPRTPSSVKYARPTFTYSSLSIQA